MRLGIVTLFPGLFDGLFSAALVAKARAAGALQVAFANPRDFATDRRRTVDDIPYGGGSGMIMQAPQVVAALESLDGKLESLDGKQESLDGKQAPAHRVLLTPRGRLIRQARVEQLASLPAVSLVCGRYEGIDQRVANFVDEELSLGDFVLAGGEVAAMVLTEAMARLLDNVVGNAQSLREESFADGRLEYPQYTRPRKFRGFDVPSVLTSGDHAAIAAWRAQAALRRTQDYRPDLLRAADGVSESQGGGDNGM